jgi:hypothetical protein
MESEEGLEAYGTDFLIERFADIFDERMKCEVA